MQLLRDNLVSFVSQSRTTTESLTTDRRSGPRRRLSPRRRLPPRPRPRRPPPPPPPPLRRRSPPLSRQAVQLNFPTELGLGMGSTSIIGSCALKTGRGQSESWQETKNKPRREKEKSHNVCGQRRRIRYHIAEPSANTPPPHPFINLVQ